VIGRRLILVSTFLCLACARLPAITPVDGGRLPGTGRGPCSVFPEGNWQFLHAIKAELTGGVSFMSLGLTVMSSRNRTNRSVIMTFEGFVLFDGEYDGRLIVHRALPPFDSPHFAEGLMDDIRLVLFEPEGALVGAGLLESGSSVCRHEAPGGGVVDVESQRDGAWGLMRYSREQRLIRSVRALPPDGSGTGFPTTIELTAHGSQNYKLVLTLIEAVAIAPKALFPLPEWEKRKDPA
jgi:hypothetical protein